MAATIPPAPSRAATITITGTRALWALAAAATIFIGHAYRDVRRL